MRSGKPALLLLTRPDCELCEAFRAELEQAFPGRFDVREACVDDRPEWRTLRAVREGRVVRLTESSSNRPSPRAPQAVRSLRALLASLTTPTPSGDSR